MRVDKPTFYEKYRDTHHIGNVRPTPSTTTNMKSTDRPQSDGQARTFTKGHFR